MPAPDFFNLIAQQRGAPPLWRWYELRWYELRGIDHSAIVKGAVCTATYKRGKRAGETNWTKRDRSTEREYIISEAELSAFRDKWEREGDRCQKCGGDGREFAGWSAGVKTRDCRRCNATGKAPSLAQADEAVAK